MIQDRLVWRTTVALILLLMMAVVSVVSYTQGNAPEIVFAGFSSEIDADGVPNYGYISFKDLDKDLSQIRFEVVVGQGSNLVINPGWQYDPGMQGESSGTLQFTIAAQAPGQYELQLILVDTMGNESAPEVVAFIAKGGAGNLPPIAVFSVSPVAAKAGEPITFDASASNDADGAVISYEWAFGDGSIAQGQQVTHTYNMEGSYTVSLTVIDDAGDFDVSTQSVSIYSEVACTPTACFSLNNSAADRESVEEIIYVGAHDPLILDGTCSTCADSHFVSVQRSDQWWNRYGPEASGWLSPAEEADIGGLNVRAFAARHGVVIQPNTYYRVGLGVAEPWDSVTRLVFISPDAFSDRTWRDDFDRPSLDTRWTWIRENPLLWRLETTRDELCLTTHRGALLFEYNNAHNLLVQEPPPGDFIVEGCLSFVATRNFQIAGLIAYLDDDHYVMLGRGYCDEESVFSDCVGSGIYLDYEEGASFGHYVLAGPSVHDKEYFRITRSGTTFTGYYSSDGQTWQEVGEQTLEALKGDGIRIGMAAFGETGMASSTARFHYFGVMTEP